jgi:hypothetical protein
MSTLIVSPATLGGTTRRRYRETLADELGSRLETTVTQVAVAGEASRVVIADELRDDEQGWGWDDQMWAYVLDGDQADTQRRVIRQPEVGYRGADAMLLLSRPTDEALAVGDAIEVTSPLPSKTIGHVAGLNQIVDQALARLPAVATVTTTGDGSDRLSLDGYPWLASDGQILGIYDRDGVTGTDAAQPSGLPFRIDADGATRHLAFGRSYSATETIEIRASLPGDHLIYDGSAWGYPTGTPGLLGEAYRAAVPEPWVLTFGMVLALRVLERLTARRRDIDRQTRMDLLAEIRGRLETWTDAQAWLLRTDIPRALARHGSTRDGSLALEVTQRVLTGSQTGAAWP